MICLAATLLLAFATAQQADAYAAAPAAAVAQREPAHGAPAGEPGAGPAAGGHAEEPTLSEVMLHHVTDGYVLEYPGICHGGFSWDCETNLKELFGDRLTFHVGSTIVDMTPTKHLVMMWLASIVLLVLVFVAVRRRDLVPRGLYNFVEMLVQVVRDIGKANIGQHDGDRFLPFLVTVFFFILFVNLFGLVPWAATATGNVSVTMALAVFTFVITQYVAIRSQGFGGFLKHLTGGVHPLLWPIMIPVEFLGLFTKPFALTIRLFANMIAGHIVILSLLGLIFALGTPLVALGSVPIALAIFCLELFVGFLQAYIFTMLSALFIGAGLAHHGADAHGSAGPGMGHAADHPHVAEKVPGHG